MLPAPQFVQDEDLLPFAAEEHRLRRGAGRRPGSDKRVEGPFRIDLQQQRSDRFEGGRTLERHHQGHIGLAAGVVPVQVRQEGCPGADCLRDQLALPFMARVAGRQPGPPAVVLIPQARSREVIRLEQLFQPRLDCASVRPAVQALQQRRNNQWVELERSGNGEPFRAPHFQLLDFHVRYRVQTSPRFGVDRPSLGRVVEVAAYAASGDHQQAEH